MMKILYVATYPSSGMVPFACSIINGMAAAGHRVYALTVSSKNLQYRGGIVNDVVQFDIDYPVALYGKCRQHFVCDHFYARIKDIVRKYNIEIVHFLTGEYGMALYFTAKLSRETCLVYTVHDLEQHPDHGTLKNNMYNSYFHAMTLRNARLIPNLCTCSRAQEKQLRALYPDKNVAFHHFPSLVTEAIKQGADICPELRGEKDYILFWGTFVEYKGVELLYHAYLDSSLADRKKLVMAGQGRWFFPRRSDERGIIRIDRYIEESEVASLFKNSAFVVYPYMQVTMSGVMTVAHYFQKAVIASDLGFFKDNCADGDVLFHCGSKEALMKAMEKMTSEESTVLPCSWNSFDISQELMEFYQSCLKK